MNILKFNIASTYSTTQSQCMETESIVQTHRDTSTTACGITQKLFLSSHHTGAESLQANNIAHI